MAEDLDRSGNADASRPGVPDPEPYTVSPDCSHEEFLAVAKVYARRVVDHSGLSVRVDDLEWKVSTRAKRWAAAVRHTAGTPTTVVLTWEYFETAGWTAMAESIRHELVHVHLLNEEDDPSHGPRFRALAERLDTAVHCERFAEPKWWVTCTECGIRLARYRRSTLTEHPERYGCGDCGGRLEVHRHE